MVGRGDRRLVGFSIGIAAERTGMHPQTLREYERKGLVTPQRTPGGSRRYGEGEIERLLRIQQLTEQGLSLAGVQYVLGLERRNARLAERVQQLEARLSQHERPAAGAGEQAPPAREPERLPVRRSVSLEIIHVPRPRRGPRWRNS